MSMVTFCRVVSEHWQALSQTVWPPSVQQLTEAEIARLGQQLRRRYHGLIRRQRRIEQLRDRFAQLQLAAAEKAELWQALASTGEKLMHHEAVYQQKRQAFEKYKRLHRAMVQGRIVVATSEDV